MPVIPASVERRARWVLDSIGAFELGFGDDVPYDEEAWEQLEHGERPRDPIAAGFYHLSRAEERGGRRDRHGRFPGSESCLDPLDPPLEKLRESLGIEPPRWQGARFAIALTHDVDVPWRWTRLGVLGTAARLKRHVRRGQGLNAFRTARSLASVPMHKIRGTDPNWRFERILRVERARGLRSTFFLMAGHAHPADGATPSAYERLRPRLVETLLAGQAEIGLHGSYLAAEDVSRLESERALLEEIAGTVHGQRYHYLRGDPVGNFSDIADLGFAYDTSLGFADTPGFRAGIAQPFRPWNWASERPFDFVEIPLALMDVTLSEERYLGLSPAGAQKLIDRIVDRAARTGGGFSVLWHTDRFDPVSARGWDRLYFNLVARVRERGGVCLSAGELAAEAAAWQR
ncbi:MAG: polysaccharide deacetylase family protein [Gaiellaceae bacterium]